MNLPEIRHYSTAEISTVRDLNSSHTFSANKSTVNGLAVPLSGSFKQQMHRKLEIVSLAAVDLTALTLGTVLTLCISSFILPRFPIEFSVLLSSFIQTQIWWLPLVVFGCLIHYGLYVKRYSFWLDTARILKANTLACLITMVADTIYKAGFDIACLIIALNWIIYTFLLPFCRYIGKNVLARAGIWNRKVLVLGAGKTGGLVVKALYKEPYLGYQVVGILEDDPGKKNKTFNVNGGTKIKILGGFRDSDRVMAETGVRDLILAAPGLPSHVLVGLVSRLKRSCESLLVVPNLFGLPVIDIEAEYFFNDRFLVLCLKNNLAVKTNVFFKRIFDLVVGTVIFLLVLPVMAVICVIVKLDSPGSVIFTDRRIGKGGKEFLCYKFRTMYTNNKEILERLLEKDQAVNREWKKYFKIRGKDPRITPVGRVLRKYSLDELTQIINVLKGEMSLVGPRPYLPRERGDMGYKSDTILLAHPGITGLWQVSGRNEIDFEGRLYMEAWYVQNWSLWLDISLLFRTVGVVLRQKGAY